MGPSQSQQKNVQSASNEEEEFAGISHPRFANLKVVTQPTEDDEGII
jgi:hypothetical protein